MTSPVPGATAPRKRRRWVYPLFLLVFTLIAVEFAARWYLTHVLDKSPDKKFRFSSYRVFEHVPGFHEGADGRDWIIINAQGFRRSTDVPKVKPPGTYRIFLMGGSAAHGISSAAPYPIVHIYPEETIDAYLETMLRKAHPDRSIEVINAAVTGYQLFQHTIYLQSELLDYDPDLVIFFDGANDHYIDNTDYGYMADFRYQFWVRRLQQPSLGSIFALTADWLAEYSGLFKAFMAWYLQHDAIKNWPDGRLPFTTAENAITLHEQVAPRQYLRSLETNLFLLRRDSIAAIVCLQPELVLRDSTRSPASERALLRPDPSIVALYPVVRDEVRTVTDRYQVPFVDMNTAFNDPAFRDQQLLIDYCHLNARGGEVVAEVLAPIVEGIMHPTPVISDSSSTSVRASGPATVSAPAGSTP